ncbi:MAG TPA: cytidine deaminase, partial [Chitinophagales bacterium]|nr:cytidine deaminase [Chitinophagales bacterium]
EERVLFGATKNTCQHAYAPYSQFKVGAAVLLANGKIYVGNNQENAAYPSGLCAERVAVFQAAALNPNVPITAIAITIQYPEEEEEEMEGSVNTVASPCGACRQVLAEYEQLYAQPIKLYLLGPQQWVGVVNSVNELLPLWFTSDMIKQFADHTVKNT